MNDFKCHCNKSFDTNKKLRQHQRSHSSYDCSWDGCGKQFTRKENLKKHITTHTLHRNIPQPSLSIIVQSLEEAIQLWKRLHPTAEQIYVLKLLMALREAPQKPESLPTFKIKCSSLPTVGNILCDIIANDDIQYRNPVTKKAEGNTFDFINAWMLLHDNPGADTTKPPGTPITAWGVKASPKGVGFCNFQPPEALREPTVFISPVGNCDEFCPNTTDEQPLFHSIITPATTVSDIHDDGALIANFLVQLYGVKVLFSWPGTTANRKFFRDYHGRDHFLVLGDAISKMDGLKVTFLNPGDGVNLEPGMIHALISLTNSAIGSWEYVDAEWFDTDEIRKGTKWLLDLIKTRQQPLANEVAVAELYKPIIYGMNMWRAMLKRLDNTRDELSERRKQRIQEFVKWLQSEIPREYVDQGPTLGKTGGNCGRKKRRIRS